MKPERGVATGSTEPADDELASALAALQQSLKEAEATVRAARAFGSDAERARGYEFMLRSLVYSLEAKLIHDADFPYLHWVDFWLKGGGDNPDQRYAFSSITGGAAYRIRGSLGSACSVEIQLLAGDPWAGTGRSAAYLPFEQIDVDASGAFAIDLLPPDGGAAQAGRSQIINPADGTQVFVRLVYDRWVEEPGGEVHIDRLGWEGRRKPAPTPARTAERIRKAAAEVALRVRTWPTFVATRYLDKRPPNELSPLTDTVAQGGHRGRWMADGVFDLPEGKALVVKTWPTASQYQGIQLTDLWFDSLENEASSLNSTQALLAPDGAYHHVIAATDPGYANWLDTGGLRRGVILLRYYGVPGNIPEPLHPSAQLVDIDALSDHVPGFERVSASDRERDRAARRRHLQVRSHR